jgi:AraC-like DNA-binding protein
MSAERNRLERPQDELAFALDGFVGRVQSFVADTLRERAPSLRAIARRLHMSPRTLQRRLEAYGTSFHALVDDLRRELALAYLADPRLSLAEISFLVRFSGRSAFHRAFRKWTGRTPLQHRRSAVPRPVQGEAADPWPVP